MYPNIEQSLTLALQLVKSLKEQSNLLGNVPFFLPDSEMRRWISIICLCVNYRSEMVKIAKHNNGNSLLGSVQSSQMPET